MIVMQHPTTHIYFPLCWQACLVGKRIPWLDDTQTIASDKLRVIRRMVRQRAEKFVVSPLPINIKLTLDFPLLSLNVFNRRIFVLRDFSDPWVLENSVRNLNLRLESLILSTPTGLVQKKNLSLWIYVHARWAAPFRAYYETLWTDHRSIDCTTSCLPPSM
jgi:hypothetical protein